MKKYFFTILAALILQGCAQTKWVNYRDSSANYIQDKASCENEAIRTVPSAPSRVVINQTPAATSYTTNCQRDGADTRCTSSTVPQYKSKATAFLEGLNSGQANSGNSSDIDRYTRNCITQKGWNRETVKKMQ
jgi:hypothetical protein